MLKITKEIVYFQAGCTIFDKLLGYVFGLGQLTVISIAILGGVIIFSIITFIIVYHVCCKKKHNRVNDIQEAGPATSRNTHNRDSRKGQKGKRTVTVVAPAPHTSEASKSTRKQTSGKKSKKRSDEEDDPFWWNECLSIYIFKLPLKLIGSIILRNQRYENY